jgi:hypothetical protein
MPTVLRSGGFRVEELLLQARVADVSSDGERLSVTLEDGRRISVPLRWYPRLANATSAQSQWMPKPAPAISQSAPDVDEDLSVEGLLLGLPAPGVSK